MEMAGCVLLKWRVANLLVGFPDIEFGFGTRVRSLPDALRIATPKKRLPGAGGGFLTSGVKMMSLSHGWGCHPIQTAFPIHIKNNQSVSAHWYAVLRHTAAALLRYHPAWLTDWWPGSLAESKWCHYVIVEAAILFKLLLPSIIVINKVFELWAHWYAIHRHAVAGLLSYTHPTWLRFCDLGHL